MSRPTAFAFYGMELPSIQYTGGFGVFHYADIPKSGKINPHTHTGIEMMLIVQGDISITAEGVVYDVQPGDVVVISPGIFHRTIINNEDLLYERYVIHLSPLHVNQILASQRLAPSIFEYLGQCMVIRSRGTDQQYIRSAFSMIHSVFIADNPHADERRAPFSFRAQPIADTDSQYMTPRYIMANSMLQSLLIHAGILVRNRFNIGAFRSNPIIEKAIHYINEHFADSTLTIGRLAENSFVSEGYLSRLFKQYTGSSPYSYITCCRLSRACELLESGASVLDACVQCGYSDYTSFLRSFKALYDESPQHYRSRKTCLR